MKISVKNHPDLEARINFSEHFFEKIKFSIYLIIFKLRDRFWTLRDGPLDPLDRYKHPKKMFFAKKIIFFSISLINLSWIALKLDLTL